MKIKYKDALFSTVTPFSGATVWQRCSSLLIENNLNLVLVLLVGFPRGLPNRVLQKKNCTCLIVSSMQAKTQSWTWMHLWSYQPAKWSNKGIFNDRHGNQKLQPELNKSMLDLFCAVYKQDKRTQHLRSTVLALI